jgi:MoaA/NifB/PqqE/SkfB family radical SAM enzyme
MFPARLFFRAFRTRFIDQRPFVISHLITARCNANCLTCLWKGSSVGNVDELSTGEVETLYRDAAEAGFISLVIWGGEPMVRRDLGRLLRVAHEASLNTTLYTNGWWLEERFEEVLPWTDRLVVSVDAMGEVHDRLRRCPGLFARLERGLARVRAERRNLRVILVTVLSRLNIEQLDGVAAFGARLGAQVVFQAMNVTDYGLAARPRAHAQLQLDAPQLRQVEHEIRNLRRRGYPVRDSNAYLSRLGAGGFHYRCHYKKVVLRVEPDGRILDCTQDCVPMVNVRTARLHDFINGPLFRDFTQRAEGCNRCYDVGTVETSHIWDGRPGALWNAVRALV